MGMKTVISANAFITNQIIMLMTQNAMKRGAGPTVDRVWPVKKQLV